MPKKSCDLDSIPTSVLYDCLDEIIPIMTSIMNKSLSSGIVPQCFKQTLVKHLLKSPVLITTAWNTTGLYPICHSCQRYWSVLTIILKQFLQHLQSHSLLEPFQSAYRKCNSTETALLHVVNELPQASDGGCVSTLSLLDLSAAFDTTDHNILITRLRSTFGCSGTVLEGFIFYLSCRTQSVFVGHESTPSVLKCGVLQASVLGPRLFTLYTHPLSTHICQSGLSYHFFADDSQLHKSSVPSDFPVIACCLKDCIEDVSEWMADSKLKMDDDKTELMAIGTRFKLSQVIPNLVPMSISGCDIPFSQSVRNLGFHLDETLFMDAHIRYLCRILSCQLRRVGKIRSFLSTDAANKLAVSLILSRLDYCNSLLAGLHDNKLNKVQRIQNHAARLVQACKCNSTAENTPLASRTKLRVSVFSVSIRTVCHLIFLIFFIHTVPLGRCALLTPHCWQFLASLLRPLAKYLSVFWTHCLELTTTIPQKNTVFYNF